MVRLEKNLYSAIYGLYQSCEIFFPLIADVLLDEQDGVVYVDDPDSPSQAYVEHAFGFAQVFGKPNDQFEHDLEHYLLVDRCFNPGKIRLYAPYLPKFLTPTVYDSMRSFRQRFILDAERFLNGLSSGYGHDHDVVLRKVNAGNISLINEKLGLVTRFWRTEADFIRKSNAVVAFYEGEPASICYSAAEADHRVEIDVLTLPECRKRGLAKLAVIEFIRRCISMSLRPLWDCFTNNSGSMMLCQSVGFVAATAPYPFYTINKQKE